MEKYNYKKHGLLFIVYEIQESIEIEDSRWENEEKAKKHCKLLNGNVNYIIKGSKDGNHGHWSEEEGGRFSAGALREKIFQTKLEAEKYNKCKNINGIIIPYNKKDYI